MKKSNFLFLLICLSLGQIVRANGICIVDASAPVLFQLTSSDLKVVVNDQIATVTSTLTFKNTTGGPTQIKFGFPMSETGSAISLRWQNEGVWYTADFSTEPQDTTLPGGGGGGQDVAPAISDFLGTTPLYFDLEQEIQADSFITIELVYVDLLPYAFSKVSFSLNSDYTAFQTSHLNYQHFLFVLNSQRTIESIELVSHAGSIVTNNSNTASVEWTATEQLADQNYYLEYVLDADQLGIFPFSTYQADSTIICDDYGRGYFAFIVEPDPSENTQVIEKVFTLIIDRSGSMGGEKIVQAKSAASFIVNSLNPNDKFNLVSFSTDITSFAPDHVNYTISNKEAALDYINEIYADGSTNISGAFSEAIPDFANSSANVANIVIFLTDGEATAGITSTQGILDHVHDLINTYEVQGLSIFTFGIGSSTNVQLLSLLANNNNGVSEFLENQELEATISNFYLTIQNPVLLQPQMTFTPAVIHATHPENLPNLFKGQQLIVVGRYDEPTDVQIHFSGTAFGQPVSYDYTVALADSSIQALQFLPRLWAKQTMKDLYQTFYTYAPGDPAAAVLEDSIVNLSVCYGVISPFTSFEDNSGGGVSTLEESSIKGIEFSLQVSPNPFSDRAVIQLSSLGNSLAETEILIFDTSGRLVRRFVVPIGASNQFQIEWDGLNEIGGAVPSCVYFIKANLNGVLVTQRVVKL